MSLPPAFQNQKVQIGIIVAGALVALIFLFTQILGGTPPSDPGAMGPMGPYGPAGYGPPGAPGPGGSPEAANPYGPPGGPGGYSSYGPPGSAMAGAYGSTDTTAAPAATEKKAAGPKPPRSGDPFRSTDPARDRVVETTYRSSTEELPVLAATGPTPTLYEAYRWEKAAEGTIPGAPVPEAPDIPMRMAGVLWGPRVYGLLEVNGQVDSYTPGDTVANIYLVERIERDRIILSKRLSNGKRKKVEVPLAGSPYASQYQGYDPNAGVPGTPGGYGAPGGYPGAPGGYPGSGPGGYPGSGPGAPPYGPGGG
jgi:hypothetical protein